MYGVIDQGAVCWWYWGRGGGRGKRWVTGDSKADRGSRGEQQDTSTISMLSICPPDWPKYKIRAHSRVSPVVLSFGNFSLQPASSFAEPRAPRSGLGLAHW